MNNQIEYVDLVDETGKIQKRRIPRTDAHLFPNLHLQIVILVVFDSKGNMLVHQRGKKKKVNPGDIDHVCGGVMSGETVEEAAERESMEETGVKPHGLKVVTRGVNKYNRFRYLLVGFSEDIPHVTRGDEVEWVRFIHPNELKKKEETGEYTFVDEFFEDTAKSIRVKKTLV